MLKQKSIYLILCVIGALLPLSQFVPWLIDNGFNITLFIQELFSTRIGSFFGLDVIVSAVVLVFFVLFEGNRIRLENLWLPILATLSVGVSLGLPLFLYMRQGKIESKAT